MTCVLAVVWFVLTRDDPPHDRISGRLQLPFGSLTAWLLILTFGLMGSIYYGLNAWLADAYSERGWSDTSTGVLVAMMNISAIPCSFLIPWLSERYGGRIRWLSIMSVVFFAGALGLVEAPAGAYGWSLLAGTAQGGMFALTMTLPLDLEHDRARLGSLVAMMLGGGYILAATAPFVLGAVRDSTGSFTAVLRCVVGFCVLLFLVIRVLARVTRKTVDAQLTPSSTSEALTMAVTSLPSTSPSSRAASVVIDATSRTPPASSSMFAVASPCTMPVTLAGIWLRALSFMGAD